MRINLNLNTNSNNAINDRIDRIIGGLTNYVKSYYPNKSVPKTVSDLVDRLCRTGLPINVAKKQHIFTANNSLIKVNLNYTIALLK